MLKRIFYASASILMLAFAYHLGATNALSQSGGFIEGAAVDNAGTSGTAIVGAVGRIYYRFFLGRTLGEGAGGAPIPGTAPVIATGGIEPIVLLANGDIYWNRFGTGWEYQGNLTSGPTPAAQQTFGQLKAQYRK